MSDRFQSFAEFWPFYVREHADRRNRLAHFVGTTLAFVCVGAALAGASPWWLAAAVPVGYAPAWFGHFALQKNRPATFTYPAWSFMADMRMWALTLLGKMQAEVDKHSANSLK